MKIKSPADLLLDQIRDLFSVETQVSQTMPELAAQSPDSGLRVFLAAQEEASLNQIERLERAAALLGSSPDGDRSEAMKGLIEGGNKHIDNAEGEVVTNLILTAHVNRIIHYQIAGYDVADALAKQLGISGVDSLLETSLHEERMAARTLAELSVKFFSAVKGAENEKVPP